MGGESDSRESGRRKRTDDSVTSGRKNGRPRKVDGPRVPYDEIDRLLVFGEVVEAEAGGTTVSYPSYRDLARRYGCTHSLIATYARKHDCLRRRQDAKARVTVKAEQKLVEMRANALALSKDDALRMIDTYLAGFEKALGEGRVRFDNPTDFNTMLRLKEFILGGADSRQEIHAALSLEDIQARHQRMLRASQQASAEERGEVLDVSPAEDDEGEHAPAANPPAPPAEDAAGEVNGHFRDADPGPVTAHGPPSCARADGWDDDAEASEGAPHGANVAPTGPGSATPAIRHAPPAAKERRT